MSNNKDFKVKNGIQPTVYQEGVGTVVSGVEGYYLSGASYDSVSFSVTTQENSPQAFAFSYDGTKMYVGGGQNNTVYQYTLSTAWDLSTASYASKSFSYSGQETGAQDIAFKTDGTKMFIIGTSGDDVNEYTLSTAWDVSTASFVDSFSVSAQETSPQGVTFNPGGDKMYVTGNANDAVFQYTLSTAWDVSSASYASKSLSVGTEEGEPRGVEFNSDGTQLFITGSVNDKVSRYDLTTAYDLSTGSYSGVSFPISQDGESRGPKFKSDGSKMFILGFATDTIYQYSTALSTASLDLSSGSVFDYTPTSDVQVTLTNPAASGTSSGATLLLTGAGTAGFDVSNASYDSVSLSIAGQETQGQGLSFKTDGTKMYVIGTNGDDVNEYNLSTAWNISTASYSQNFSVSAQEINPSDITFKTDGTEMYIVGSNGDEVNQFTLSTAWDISTASYTGTFSVATQETSPSGIFFKSDGTRMYITGYAGDDVNEYNLSTAWNISTASFVQLFSVAAQEANPQSLSFSSDGTKMFVLGENGLDVNFYSLSTAWNISTASFSSAFALTAGEVAVRGLAFSNDGYKMYILDENDDTIRQYSSATPATITYDPNLQWPSGTAPTSPAIGETDVLTFNTTDGGTTYKSVLAIDGAK
jgi:DNA-binding beta-propeller fold protein YncE